MPEISVSSTSLEIPLDLAARFGGELAHVAPRGLSRPKAEAAAEVLQGPSGSSTMPKCGKREGVGTAPRSRPARCQLLEIAVRGGVARHDLARREEAHAKRIAGVEHAVGVQCKWNRVPVGSTPAGTCSPTSSMLSAGTGSTPPSRSNMSPLERRRARPTSAIAHVLRARFRHVQRSEGWPPPAPGGPACRSDVRDQQMAKIAQRYAEIASLASSAGRWSGPQSTSVRPSPGRAIGAVRRSPPRNGGQGVRHVSS